MSNDKNNNGSEGLSDGLDSECLTLCSWKKVGLGYESLPKLEKGGLFGAGMDETMELPLWEEWGQAEDGQAVGEPPLAPKTGVRRILDSTGVHPSDTEAFWLGVHMEEFVAHTREHGELLDIGAAAEGSVSEVQQKDRSW